MFEFDFKSYNKVDEDLILENISKLDSYNMYQHDFMNFDLINIDEIKSVSNYIKQNSEVLIVIGVGGSYLGAKSIIELFSKSGVYFIGDSLSSDNYDFICSIIESKDVMVNVISKSGNTFEINLYFDLIKEQLIKKYGSYSDRLIITTTEGNTLSSEPCYKVLYIPNNIGGRYSVFTPAGLLPLCVSGIDIEDLLLGAKSSIVDLSNQKRYASIRYILNSSKNIEAFVVYDFKLYYFSEWLKQLFAESLGKNKDGLLPISLIYSRDLHSMEQYILDGKQILFETVLFFKSDSYLGNLNEVCQKSVSKTHYENGIVNNVIKVSNLTEYSVGYLMQFFMVSCVFNGVLSDINPFNQEKVELYKKNLKDSLKTIDFI